MNETDLGRPTVGQGATMARVWRRLSGPVKIGLICGLLGIVLTVIGILRDPDTPDTLWAFAVGSLISGGTWGLVSWAIATAAVEVERDIDEDRPQ